MNIQNTIAVNKQIVQLLLSISVKEFILNFMN